MFDSFDHTSQMLNNFLKDDCNKCEFEDGDDLFNKSVMYANTNGTQVVLASKIAYDLNRVPYDFLVQPNQRIMTSNISTGLVNQEADNLDHVIKRYPIFYKLSSNPEKVYLSLALQSVLSYYKINDFSINQDVKNGIFTINNISIPTFGKEASFLVNYSGPTSSIFHTFKRYPLYQIIDDKNYDLSSIIEDDNWIDKYIDINSIYYSKFGKLKVHLMIKL